MDYAALKALKPEDFEDAARGYRAASDMAGHAKDGIQDRIRAKMRESLSGEAADAAHGQLHELAEDFHYMQVECGLVSTALNAFAADVRPAKKKLDAAVADAEAKNFSIGADGSVSYPAAGDKVDGETPKGGSAHGLIDETARAVSRQAANFAPNPNFAHAQQCADRIAEALKEATEADDKWAPALRKLQADDDLAVTDKDWADVLQDTRSVREGAKDYLSHIKSPPKNGSPKDNASWWNGLSQQERDDYLAVYPKAVGALDGIPSTARDEANRTVLAEAHADAAKKLHDIDAREPKKYEQRINNITGLPIQGSQVETFAWKKWKEERDKANGLLGSMDAIQSRLEATGEDKLPRAYLLGFEDKGLGRSIVANGNPDTADHTAVFVPGTTSNLGKSKSYIQHMTDLWQASNSVAQGQQVSTISWIGYDAPQSIVPEAMSRSYAEKAAPTLNKFLEGVETAQGGADKSHTTVIGHSYGSTLVGASSIQGRLPADDIVVAGSPGMLVGHAEDLDVGKDHVWSEAASLTKDQVPAGGKLAGLGGPANGPEWLYDLLPFGSVANQNVPSDEDFGAHIMETDAEKHGDYWRNGSVSLENQANVVTGRYGKVTHG
ncbi:alpha/beta hydrolase [Streptomyces sp. NPDC050610]|uniref:alpha/beta hydrolase n=1 Tax=Streptomyces sp. NPDC050610 TaxID=3157097 RepID=UPI0034278068